MAKSSKVARMSDHADNCLFVSPEQAISDLQEFLKENPDEVEAGFDFTSNINPDSLDILSPCYVEPTLKSAKSGDRFQFERLGYFCVDPDSSDSKLVFNRTVPLRDTWARIEKAQKS